MSWALAAENDAARRAPPRAARNKIFTMSTAPVGGRPIDWLVDAIGPHADRPLERLDSLVPRTPQGQKCGLLAATRSSESPVRLSPRIVSQVSCRVNERKPCP